MKHSYSDVEKREIAQQLKAHTDESATKDLKKLKLVVENGLDIVKPLSPVGLTFIENYVHIELLSTQSKHRISFYDFWYNRDFYMSRDASTKKLIASIKTNKPYLSDVKVGKQVFNLYYGGISIFRPINAAKIYAQFKPTSILDFTMGWGGRMIGAVVMNVPKYIGIDLNPNLVEPYNAMVEQLMVVNDAETEHKSCPTKIELYFKNALDMDYSQLDYDMVFTSPPFYDKETYSDMVSYLSKNEWDEKFYRPVFEKTWQHLKSGGVYCLNVPQYLYERVCVDAFGGEAHELVELKKYSRVLPKNGQSAAAAAEAPTGQAEAQKKMRRSNVGQKYKEYIYVWHKK